MKNLATTIGGRTRLARTRLALTQADAAERVGISTEFYARIERGGTMPSVPTLVKIATELETSADELLGLAGTSERAAGAPAKPPRGATESVEMRRLIRRLRGASPATLRLLGLVAKAINRSPQKARSAGAGRGRSRRR
jgi:transcriptional regulator with XRE-family HTH domain